MSRLDPTTGLTQVQIAEPPQRAPSVGPAVTEAGKLGTKLSGDIQAERELKRATLAVQSITFDRDERGQLISPELPEASGTFGPTLFEEAYSAQMLDLYKNRLSIDIAAKATELARTHRFDPQGFDNAWQAFSDQTVESALPLVQAEVATKLQARGLEHFNNVANEKARLDFVNAAQGFEQAAKMSQDDIAALVTANSPPELVLLKAAELYQDFEKAVTMHFISEAGQIEKQIFLNNKIAHAQMAGNIQDLGKEEKAFGQKLELLTQYVEGRLPLKVIEQTKAGLKFVEKPVSEIIVNDKVRQLVANDIRNIVVAQEQARSELANYLARQELLAAEMERIRLALDFFTGVEPIFSLEDEAQVILGVKNTQAAMVRVTTIARRFEIGDIDSFDQLTKEERSTMLANLGARIEFADQEIIAGIVQILDGDSGRTIQEYLEGVGEGGDPDPRLQLIRMKAVVFWLKEGDKPTKTALRRNDRLFKFTKDTAFWTNEFRKKSERLAGPGAGLNDRFLRLQSQFLKAHVLDPRLQSNRENSDWVETVAELHNDGLPVDWESLPQQKILNIIKQTNRFSVAPAGAIDFLRDAAINHQTLSPDVLRRAAVVYNALRENTQVSAGLDKADFLGTDTERAYRWAWQRGIGGAQASFKEAFTKLGAGLPIYKGFGNLSPGERVAVHTEIVKILGEGNFFTAALGLGDFNPEQRISLEVVSFIESWVSLNAEAFNLQDIEDGDIDLAVQRAIGQLERDGWAFSSIGFSASSGNPKINETLIFGAPEHFWQGRQLDAVIDHFNSKMAPFLEATREVGDAKLVLGENAFLMNFGRGDHGQPLYQVMGLGKRPNGEIDPTVQFSLIDPRTDGPFVVDFTRAIEQFERDEQVIRDEKHDFVGGNKRDMMRAIQRDRGVFNPTPVVD